MQGARIGEVSLMIAALVTLAVTPVLAERGKDQGERTYDPASEVTVRGTVEEVKQIPGPQGGPGGTHLTLEVEAKALDVHLGPTTFVQEQSFSFARGDRIEVTGSKAKIRGAEALVAREVKKGDKTLTLRNAQGIPLWSGGRRGSAPVTSPTP